MEHQLPVALGITPKRADALYDHLYHIFLEHEDSADRIKEVINTVTNPVERALLLFEAGRIETEMGCPMHRIGVKIGGNIKSGSIEIVRGTSLQDIIQQIIEHETGKKRPPRGEV
jgi:hypothetical protein